MQNVQRCECFRDGEDIDTLLVLYIRTIEVFVYVAKLMCALIV